MGPRASKYKENSRGPKTEPCGTPYDIGAEEDSKDNTESSVGQIESKPLKSFSTHALNPSKQMLTSAKTRVMIKVFSYDILDIASDCQSGVLAFINSENDT